MALTWDLGSIKDRNKLCWVKSGKFDEDGKELVRLNPVTETLIWATMNIGIGRITQINAPKFYRRMFIWGKVFDPYSITILGKFPEPSVEKPITFQQVKDHIGLSTNAGNETDAEWKRRLVIAMFREHSNQADREMARSNG